LHCAATGNHVGSSPPRVLVYPARYPRVIAVCGVMADGRPYADLDETVLEGSFGPASVMGQAIAAYTPNIPWPQYGCRGGVRLNGDGTSAATPQVAAAAALWLESRKQRLPRDWRRVEAVRHALFSTARTGDAKHFGNGILQAHSALGVAPDLNRSRSPTSKAGGGEWWPAPWGGGGGKGGEPWWFIGPNQQHSAGRMVEDEPCRMPDAAWAKPRVVAIASEDQDAGACTSSDDLSFWSAHRACRPGDRPRHRRG
jgi:Subtilase family